MESDIASTGQLYSLLGWIDKNRKQIISATVVVVVIGIVVAFVIWRNEQKQIEAGEALSAVMAGSGSAGPAADALFKVANDYSGTDAGARALLEAAGDLFVAGKTAEAQSAFEEFVGRYDGNPLMSQAKLGMAVCLEAQGKTNEATAAFKEVAERYAFENTSVPAKFYLAGLYEAQGKPELARDLYMDLARSSQGTFGSQAMARLSEMFLKNPSLRPGAAVPKIEVAPEATNSAP
jgi:predicted negative regulator of RcsB-dependent stress response